MPTFDAETLRQLRTEQEVSIRTARHPENAVVIWAVVAGDDVFVRSYRGAKGRWYKDLATGGPATLEVSGRALKVLAFPAKDPASIARTSEAFLSKYKRSSHAADMVRPETLPTTMRLEPR